MLLASRKNVPQQTSQVKEKLWRAKKKKKKKGRSWDGGKKRKRRHLEERVE